MPRQPRMEGAGLVHHVTGRGHPAREPYPDDTARRGFFALIATAARALRWQVFAYCVLSTHFHLLVRTEAPNLGVGMRQVLGRHAQLLNGRLGRSGPVWGDRFHSRRVESDRHITNAAVYVDVNAVAAGLCDDPADWPWSSYRANAGLVEPLDWHRVDLLHSFMGAQPGDAAALYREIVAARVQHELAKRGRLQGLTPQGTDPPGD